MHLDVCFLVGTMCASKFGLGWAYDDILVARHMIMHFSCIRTILFSFWYICWLVLFNLSLSLSLFLSLSNSLRMTPKCKSTPSRNPLCSRESSSSNFTPFHVRFRVEKAHKDFSENFSKRGIHLKCHIILLDFFDIDLLTVIHRWGWESLCKISVSCPFLIIQEFYSNMHGFDYSIPHFLTTVRGIRIVLTPKLISDVLHVSRVPHSDYPGCSRLKTVSKDELLSLFFETPSS